MATMIATFMWWWLFKLKQSTKNSVTKQQKLCFLFFCCFIFLLFCILYLIAKAKPIDLTLHNNKCYPNCIASKTNLKLFFLLRWCHFNYINNCRLLFDVVQFKLIFFSYWKKGHWLAIEVYCVLTYIIFLISDYQLTSWYQKTFAIGSSLQLHLPSLQLLFLHKALHCKFILASLQLHIGYYSTLYLLFIFFCFALALKHEYVMRSSENPCSYW